MVKLVLGLAALLAVVFTAQAPPQRRATRDSHPLLPRAEAMRVLAAGHREVVADYFYILMLQQVTLAKDEHEHRDIIDYANLCVALDPQFRNAYITAALTAPFNLGSDRWVNTIESTELVRQAIKQFGSDEKLEALLAFNLTFYLRDYATAAELFGRLAERPGAAKHYKALSLRLMSQAGQLDKALALSQTLAEAADDEETKEFFATKTKEVELEGILREVELSGVRFLKERGSLPSGVIELVQAGYLATFPTDPLGGRIYLDKEGTARSSSRWYRLQLYETKRKLATQKAIGPETEFVPQTND